MRMRMLLVAVVLSAIAPASAHAAGGVWTPIRVAPSVAKGSADLPRMALEADGTAIAAWSESNSVRAAARLPGGTFGAPRAIGSSTTLAVPDAVVAVGATALVLLHS